jgi:hypothetical protein
MRGIVTKRKAACKISVNVKINGSLKFRRHSKFRGLTVFGTFKSFGGGYRVSHGRTLKMSSNTASSLVTLTEMASVTTANRKKSTKFKSSDVLGHFKIYIQPIRGNRKCSLGGNFKLEQLAYKLADAIISNLVVMTIGRVGAGSD